MRIAIAQTSGTRLAQWQETWALLESLLADAAHAGADAVLLPECVWPAYWLSSRQAYFEARAGGLPDSAAFLKHLTQQARAQGVMVCAGYVEECGGRLFNSACLIDGAGRCLGVHRKCFLWDFDHDLFEPGESIAPIETPWGRIGLMVCADARLPEIAATLATRGANLLLQPTAWVNTGTPPQLSNAQPEFLIPARAREFGFPVASASKWGVEGDTTFVGSSLICDASGRVLVQCGPRETALATADVTLTTARRPELTAAERTVLLSSAEPCRPTGDVPPIDLMPLPRETNRAVSAGDLPAAARGPNPVLAFGCLADPPQVRPAAQLPAQRGVLLSGPTPEPLEFAGVRIATMPGAEGSRFAAIRRVALEGVHAVVLFGEECPLTLLRARACENRVFLLAAGRDQWSLIDPRGCVTIQAAWPAPGPPAVAASVDLAAAADKKVAPRTDIHSGRRPTQYAF